MNTYQVFSVNNTLISAHDNAAAALKHALIYQHATGQPAHVEQIAAPFRYEVQHFTLCDGWINTWHDGETGEPTTYASFADALADLDDFLDDEAQEYEQGNIESPYERDEFRIVQVSL